jgi:hypothetical protein
LFLEYVVGLMKHEGGGTGGEVQLPGGAELKLPQEMTPLPSTGGADIMENNAGL